ncbi:hypothetical protein P3W85_28400 [Cupriavidus basilensis]|uniref:Uncharacterized protein n=1 Tax=Cupriavidus basilensis TaxID=68895 RepID=A0ABT6AW43_9BURK|nr:hypothetical protein [Cupriavidus basilensis]
MSIATMSTDGYVTTPAARQADIASASRIRTRAGTATKVNGGAKKSAGPSRKAISNDARANPVDNSMTRAQFKVEIILITSVA